MSSASSPARSIGLPTPLTSLVGREREVATLVDLLHQDDIRLLTLTGPGGVGKTRLALRVSEKADHHFPGGIWYVPLASIREPGLLLATIAQALDVRETGGRSLVDGIAHFLEGHAPLLILDNFEHVVESAPLVSELLSRCPSLTCLITSRALLRVSGEHAFPVPPLPLPPAAPTITAERASLSPAVRLFVSRAQAARQDFCLTDANAGEVEAICRRLDGLPLAIELAAARVRHLTPTDLKSRLVDAKAGAALAVLTGGPRDAPDRQQTLRYTISWSHDLLAAREQAIFRQLAVFVGGFTLEAAEAVVDFGDAERDVVEGIATLVDQSLLKQEEEPGGGSRYAMLETVREFALEQLVASGEMAAVQEAHAAYFLDMVERAAPLLYTEQQRTWLERLQAEHANLRMILARSEQPGDLDRALRLVAALCRFWNRRGYWEEGRVWLDRLLTLTYGIEGLDQATRATALTGAGWMAHYRNDYASAQTSLQEALECFRRLTYVEGQIEVLHCQALVAQSLGENQQAAELCEEACSLARDLGDQAKLAESLCYLSRAMRELGEYARATSVVQESLVLHRATCHRGGTAIALMVLGDIARDLGEPTKAREQCEESLAIFRELGEPLGEGFSLHNLAVAAYRDGDVGLARALCEESLAIFRRLDVGGAVAEVLASLGPILHAAGESASALATLNEALQLALRVGPRWVVAAILEGVASVAASQRQHRIAVELASAAAALRVEIAVPVRPNWQADLERTLATARATLGEEAFACAWAQGQERPLAEMVAAAAQVRIVAPVRLARTVALQEIGQRSGLSPRELDVLRLLEASKTDREIAETLYISPRTASKHVGAILEKLDVATRGEAAVYAVRNGLV